MSVKEKQYRRLVIKTFHINQVTMGGQTKIENQKLSITMPNFDKKMSNYEQIKDIQLEIIEPKKHDRWTNSIMDIIPISTKVLGNLGEGTTHTLTGVYVMLTGVDEAGQQVAEFGSSEGTLKEKLVLNKAGTPSEGDYIISFNVTLKEKQGTNRAAILQAHRCCDDFIQEIRNLLKKADSRSYTEKHEFYDRNNPSGKKVAIVKQVAGQGAMYDNQLLSKEPSGMEGGRSIIDMANVPIILSPNEYRDGALRAMT
ncbi:D-proline reductase (dithiol) PrdA/D-proline reductase (dithiol) PrdD [Tindallia californiensis]|uniref:D-proline reductase (Dithiol) PrdA/D-proline reductase (Dithiol) PrdD n=1 Tax=Tindallia californiensis TaxID=159292 RepID=A0A1H3LF23_9FIRM|nr:proline reductase cluster protein PrdD [Tindallia californiensis]SDY62769.1 D-proline reductase (dithiol) PrdA/D-proline reductase (dithiol) PrdD [Tindallia californiensis]